MPIPVMIAGRTAVCRGLLMRSQPPPRYGAFQPRGTPRPCTSTIPTLGNNPDELTGTTLNGPVSPSVRTVKTFPTFCSPCSVLSYLETASAPLKDTGLRNLPLHGYDHNEIWLQIVALAADLLVSARDSVMNS
jgi:hypothetical protein